MINTEGSDKVFQDLAQKKNEELALENQAILKQLDRVNFAIMETAKHKHMTAKAWRRVMAGILLLEQGLMPKFETETEKIMANNIRTKEGIKVQLLVRQESMLKEIQKGLAKQQEILMEKQEAERKAAEESDFKKDGV